MAISDADSKMLWGRAAGICSNPGCKAELTSLVSEGSGYNVGEMAHVVAKSVKGPRGNAQGGSDKYDNLILLCPTCHRHIDKSPEGEFPVEMLFEWKTQHEELVSSRLGVEDCSSFNDLKTKVARLLVDNHEAWQSCGPESEIAMNDPGSNIHELWDFKKISLIIPNNKKIINLIESNQELLNSRQYQLFSAFKNHASSFEQNQYSRLDSYKRFPEEFSKEFTDV